MTAADLWRLTTLDQVTPVQFPSPRALPLPQARGGAQLRNLYTSSTTSAISPMTERWIYVGESSLLILRPQRHSGTIAFELPALNGARTPEEPPCPQIPPTPETTRMQLMATVINFATVPSPFDRITDEITHTATTTHQHSQMVEATTPQPSRPSTVPSSSMPAYRQANPHTPQQTETDGMPTTAQLSRACAASQALVDAKRQKSEHMLESHATTRLWPADISPQGVDGGSPLIRTMFCPFAATPRLSTYSWIESERNPPGIECDTDSAMARAHSISNGMWNRATDLDQVRLSI